MSRTVTRGSSCNFPRRYFGHKLYLAQAKARKIEPLVSVLDSEFTPVEVIELANEDLDQDWMCGTSDFFCAHSGAFHANGGS